MNKTERAAVEALAKDLAATYGEKTGDAVLKFGRKRIAVHGAKIERKAGNRPRLRFDKVVIELLARLNAALSPSVPDGRTVMVTVTAPIRQSGKTASAIEAKTRPLLARRAATTEFTDTIHENAVRVRVAKTNTAAPKVVGFVHNPGIDTRAFLDLIQSLIAVAPKKSSAVQWLLLLDSQSDWPAATWRQIFAALPTRFENVVIVLANGRIAFLTEP